MSNEVENIETPKKIKPKKSFIMRFFKWTAILFGLLILLIVGIFIFIQTDTFDRIALGFALDKINAGLAPKDAVIYAESLEGNLFKGFTLKNGSVKVKGDTLLKFNTIEANYNVWQLLDKKISVQNITLRNPQINLTKVKDKNDSLKWNLTYLLESDTPDEDTTKSEFDWGITAESVNIQNGSVRILADKNSTLPIRDIVMQKLDTFDFDRIDMNNLNLNLSAKYFPDEKNVDIKNLAFNTNSDFNLKNFSIIASVDEEDSVTLIRDLAVVTDRSDIKINELRIDDLNPLGGIDYEHFENKHTKLDLDAGLFDFKDLTFFLPALNFMDSTVSLRLAVEGNYGNLNISGLDLILPNSKFSFTGNVKNLDEPVKLYFDVTGKNFEIDPRDTRINLPGLSIPDYSYLGKVYIPSVTYKGEPDRFTSDFDVRSSAGNARGNVYIDLTQSVIVYKGDVTTTNVNIGKIVKDKSLESSITGNFDVNARGFDYRKMTGKVNYNLQRTKFLGQNITKSDGILNFNNGNIGLDLSYNSEAVNTRMKGKVNISNLNNISYDIKGSASGLNISSFTQDNGQKSNLNFDFDLNGRGTDPNSITGNFKINMNASTFAEYSIPATPMDIQIDQNGNVKKLSLKSDFLDLDVDGAINVDDLTRVIAQNIDKIKNEFTGKIYADSVRPVLEGINNFPVVCSNLNFSYTIDAKNLDPLYSFTGNDTIKFKGYLKGNLSDSCGIFAFNSEGIIRELEMKDSVFITDSALVNIKIRNDVAGERLTKFFADVDLRTSNIVVSKITMDTTQLKFTFIDNKNDLVLWTKRDSTIRIFTEVSIEDSAVVTFDSLSVRFNDVLATNNDKLIVKTEILDSSMAFDFRQFTINSMDQKLNVSGRYSLDDTSNVKISASNINLGYYQKLYYPDVDTSGAVRGRIRYVDIYYKGTLENPDINFSATSEILRLGSTKIGRLDASVLYKDDDFKPNINFYNENNTGKFSLTGNFPYLNPYISDKLDSSQRAERLMDKQVSLNAEAKNFQLKVLQQLLPYTANLEGILDGKINLSGTPEQPQLTGNMDVSKGGFYVTLTKMLYNFEAGLTTENENLIIKNSKVFVADEPSRFISTTGYVDFTGLTLNDISLEMTGDVKAFDKDNGATEIGFSGDLWVGSGNPRLNLKGNSDRFDLKGQLVLIKGNVIFNPFVQEAYNLYGDDFLYGVIIDSLRADSTRTRATLLQKSDSIVVLTGLNLNPFEQILYTNQRSDLKKKVKQTSGKFFYDIFISTSENVFLRFIVNAKSQQEFFGEIQTDDLNIYNYINYEMRGRGTVTLSDSYYKFFKKFDATGDVVFNSDIKNPTLNINATYTGYASNSSQSNQQNIEDVTIDMRVTGYASNPILTISLKRGGATESGPNATSDAISFLLFGKFKDQLSFGESTSFGANIGASFLSNYVSSSLEDIFPFLINTNLNYVDSQTGTIAQNTDIRFTAAVGDAIIRFGGQIFKGIANTDIVIDYPLNKLFKMKSLSNNLILRLEKIYDPFAEQNDVANTNGSKTGAIIYYRIKF
ncbi:MAG: hypothetical protein SGI89_13110 [bacterium]|nr:hypothetical protein [bacterium]